MDRQQSFGESKAAGGDVQCRDLLPVSTLRHSSLETFTKRGVVAALNALIFLWTRSCGEFNYGCDSHYGQEEGLDLHDEIGEEFEKGVLSWM